jgi:hypothetical protein
MSEAATHEMLVARWEREHAELRHEIVCRVIRMTDNRPPVESDHPNLQRVYAAVRDLMSHHYPSKPKGGSNA